MQEEVRFVENRKRQEEGQPKGQSNNMKKPEIWRRANRAISATKQKMVKNEIEKRTITSIT